MTNENFAAEPLGLRAANYKIVTHVSRTERPATIVPETVDGLSEALSALSDYLSHSYQELRRLRLNGGSPDSVRNYVGEVDCRLGRFRRLLRSEFVRQFPEQASEHQQPPAPCAPVDWSKADKRLTKREREVLRLIVQGYTNKQGARTLEISPRTFESHRYEIMGKLGAKNTAELVRVALEHPDGLWLDPQPAITRAL